MTSSQQLIADVEESDASAPATPTASRELAPYAGPWLPAAQTRPRVGVVIPAYNEESSIEAVIGGLLAQTRLPDEVHIIINNTTDDTFWVAKKLAGRHERTYKDETMSCDIHIHDVGKLPTRKVGALNIGFALVEHCDYFVGVDGDTVLARTAIANLLEEIRSDSRIGGISAIFSIDYNEGRNGGEKFLIAGQRQQFASFNMLNLLRGRNMAVLGGQCSIFSMTALKAVRDEFRQLGPWVTDSEVEDSLLSIQLKSLGYATKISASARANVGPMLTLKSLDAQQVKWSYGAIDLMWPGQRGDLQGQPFHPNLRLRWYENWGMLFNLLVRVGFVLLLLASLSIGAYTFSPWWLIPPALATLMNLRNALSMHDRSAKDVAFAVLFLPGEFYLWLKIGHFIRAWTKFLSREEVDNWGAQAAAERGKANNAHLMPLVYLGVAFAVMIVTWTQLPLMVKEIILWVAWPALALVASLQSAVMIHRLLRRQRGFLV
ncbi:MAG: glycosyltransferase family 2 protein [Propionibacteriaceae bacterium]|nr:glycosyltransferase family 2 protein [Propionibacteriaceae bacterium]